MSFDFEGTLKRSCVGLFDDPAHDLLHIRRVVANALRLAKEEHALIEVVEPAAWFHDCVVVPKSDPRRMQASKLSAEQAIAWLREIGYSPKYFDAITHAIEAHSFSAGIRAETIEAKIVQDADRLDGIGAIGIARCFTVGGVLKRPFYDADDAFAESREWNDRAQTIDHFYVKLFKTAESMQTKAGKREAMRRADLMRHYLAEFRREITF